MEEFWLAIDCGGTYLKVGLYDRQGKEYHIERQALKTLSPKPGYSERNMADLWEICASTIQQVMKNSHVRPECIKGIGISAQGKGIFLLDKNDIPLENAILSADRRALNIVKKWQEDHIPEAIYPLTKQTLWTGHPVSILRWLKENNPEIYHQIGTIFMSHDYGYRRCLWFN